jgi:hypothetical protein
MIDNTPVPPPITVEQEWYETGPVEPGLYWFFGEPFMGDMGGHYSGTVKPEYRLYLVQVFQASNSLMATTVGTFVPLTKWDGKNKGYLGKWAQCHAPQPPLVTVDRSQLLPTGR